jgi:hypothetical protein
VNPLGHFFPQTKPWANGHVLRFPTHSFQMNEGAGTSGGDGGLGQQLL